VWVCGCFWEPDGKYRQLPDLERCISRHTDRVTQFDQHY
jgi:hypothetical protein